MCALYHTLPQHKTRIFQINTMPLKPKHQRLVWILAGLFCLALSLFIILRNLNDQLVFFYTPTEAIARNIGSATTIRLGGLVKTGSIKTSTDTLTVTFLLTDTTHDIPISYTGILPNLFKEGQGTVAEGAFDATGTFIAKTLLTKHDEKYMPPELVQSLKHTGQWKVP